MRIRVKVEDEIYAHEVNPETTTIGRSRENDLVIPIDDFSRKHCVITNKNGYLFIMDLGSKNGVSVDGRKIAPNVPTPIYENSKIFLANHFELVLHEGTIRDSSRQLILDEIPIKRK